MRRVRDPSARERIVEVAADVVAAEGLHGATMRRIASAAGVTTGYITHYFDDKHALIVEVLRHSNARAAARVLRAAGDGPGVRRLEKAVEAMLPLDATRRREWQVWISVWGKASPGDEFGAGYRAGWTGLRAIFVDLLTQAVAEEALRADVDLEFEAERLVTMLAGIGLLAGVSRPAGVKAQAKRMLSEQIASLHAPAAV